MKKDEIMYLQSGQEKDLIDFVILWVDGNDPVWQKKRDSFRHSSGDDSAVRYRDWENLKFWFRSVEKYAPWVRMFHFISDGQIPDWLDTGHPRIDIVDHRDFIPKE